MSREDALSALADRWRDAPAKELANAQSYIIELCEALGVERPRPSGSGYEFEFAVRIVNRDGTESANRVDLFKEGHFLLEAKDMAPAVGGSRRDDSGLGPGSPELRLRRAFGQASSYAAFVPGGPPPYLMVLDVGRTLRLWDRWAGSYGGFQGAVRTIDLTRLARNPDDVEFLRLVWEDPKHLDPNVKSAEVTREIATKLAKLAARLEATGEDQERVARFLIRCVFTMFAEDVGLLRDDPFTAAVENGLAEEAVAFEAAVEGLWAAMDEGLQFGVNRLLRFNGHFFHDRDVIPLDRDALAVLLEAARADWSHVEPSIFGTLLTRALDREERHRLGAEFTPRAYVERLVRPTIEEPVRERWTLVQAEVLQLREHGTAPARKKAVERLRSFHDDLRSIRVLDPACGSGNFLYVSLNLLKEIELEVTREIEEITGQKEHDVDPVGTVDMKVQSEYGERLRLPPFKSVALALTNSSTAITSFREDVGGGGRLWLRNHDWIRPAKEGVSGSALASREFEFFLHDEDFFVEQALRELSLTFTAHQHNRFARGFVRRAGGMRAALALVRQDALSVLSVLAFDRSEQPGLLVDQIIGFMVRDHGFEEIVAREKVRKLLPELLRRELVARGIGQTCPECEMADWYPIEGLREVLHCQGGLAEFQLEGRGPQYRIRINELARRFLRGSGGRAVLECASTLKRIDPSVAISFGANVIRGNGEAAEIDIIALTPDGMLFGECKSFFDPTVQDLMALDKSVRSLLEISAEAGVPEAVVGVACSHDEDRVRRAVQAHRAWADDQDVHLDLVLNGELFIGTTDHVDPTSASYHGIPQIKPRERCIIGTMKQSFGFGASEPIFHTDVIDSWNAELVG